MQSTALFLKTLMTIAYALLFADSFFLSIRVAIIAAIINKDKDTVIIPHKQKKKGVKETLPRRGGLFYINFV